MSEAGNLKSRNRGKAAGTHGTPLHVETIQKNAGGSFFYDGTLAKKTPYQHVDVRLLWQFFFPLRFF